MFLQGSRSSFDLRLEMNCEKDFMLNNMKNSLLYFEIVTKIILLTVVSLNLLSIDAKPNLCPKENPYQYRNNTFCCSVPVEFRWKKSGYCYGKSYKCSNNKKCADCKFFFLFF